MPIERPKTARALQAKLARKRALIRTLIAKSHLSAASSQVFEDAAAPATGDDLESGALHDSTGIVRIQPVELTPERLADIIPFPSPRSRREG